MSEIDQLTPAEDFFYCIRRVHPNSSHWRQKEKQPTTGAFGDKSGQLSVDLSGSLPTVEDVREEFRAHIQSKGVGFAIAQAKPTNDSLKARNIKVENTDQFGRVYHQPVQDNPNHGIISGKDTKAKQKALKEVFVLLLEPVNFSDMYPD